MVEIAADSWRPRIADTAGHECSRTGGSGTPAVVEGIR
jgi:hypothetical protein